MSSRLIVVSAAIIIIGAVALGYANRKAKQLVKSAPATTVTPTSSSADVGAGDGLAAATSVRAIGYGLSYGMSEVSRLPGDFVQLDCGGDPKALDRPHKGACNPFQGDTSCRAVLPVLCAKTDGLAAPATQEPGLYPAWMGGSLGATQPVMGATLDSEPAASALCEREFGQGWRMAEFADNHGHWSLQGRRGTGFGGNNRYWVLAVGQPANCWNSAP